MPEKPLVADAVRANGFQLDDHPTDPNGLIVVDATGAPAEGKVIYIGDAVVGGDTTHGSGKGPVIKSPDGTKWREVVDNDGNGSYVEVV